MGADMCFHLRYHFIHMSMLHIRCFVHCDQLNRDPSFLPTVNTGYFGPPCFYTASALVLEVAFSFKDATYAALEHCRE
ncbi:hypothetical protein D9756_006913 [Leucocoprinus leucothites]|uniref:Uncharacterized protein n=1 Tax=Leucocoprinus leucothites TaxID=201217 RepID=A0A8H5D865_9AGAR|nr:hypothetical protein D9756_006913 [Leucoagaricus leucothites]